MYIFRALLIKTTYFLYSLLLTFTHFITAHELNELISTKLYTTLADHSRKRNF